MPSSDPFILPLASKDACRRLVGGKGAPLARLRLSGFPVPDGFIVTTAAYREFAGDRRVAQALRQGIDEIETGEPSSLETRMQEIRRCFEESPLPVSLENAVVQAYGGLGPDVSVAVRSSATAEDLPDSSFAGQQDSFLHVVGTEGLLLAIRNCWASLWGARAMRYRLEREVDSRGVAMAVVVQTMVPSEVSGVLFTANPTSGDRDEIVLNASYGLGEAIVSGKVTPDTWILDRESLVTKETLIADKEVMIDRGEDSGTIETAIALDRRKLASLDDGNRRELARVCVDVERCLGGQPQDIEWAFADSRVWILQSRPITHLPPPPLKDVRWDPPKPGMKLIRRQVVENMPEPLSPLFEALYLDEGLDRSMNGFIEDLGMPFKVEEFLERPMFLTVNGFAYCKATYNSGWQMVRVLPKILLWYVTSLRGLIKGVVPRFRDIGLPTYLGTIERLAQMEPSSSTDRDLADGIETLAVADARYWFEASMAIAIAKVTDGLLGFFLRRFAKRHKVTSGMLLRGFPSETLKSFEALEAIADRVRSTPSVRDIVDSVPARSLLERLEKQPEGAGVVEDIRLYLKTYGHQVYTLDFVEPTLAEDPTPILSSLASLVREPGEGARERHARISRERDEQASSLASSLGPLRRRLFRLFLRWAQRYGPLREEALFHMGEAWPTLRRMALELGRRFADAGMLESPQDVFFLEPAEIEEACSLRARGESSADMATRAIQRRELRESRKRLHPPGMIPIGSRFKFGPVDVSFLETQKRNAEDADVLNGFAVSPGRIEGTATLILSPDEFDSMKPDTILVCPTTTPAWTPLFAHAIALVTDIGGILAHGSIVAREYGIPAVMGTGNATRRITTGQRIIVDGDAGTVTVVDAES